MANRRHLHHSLTAVPRNSFETIPVIFCQSARGVAGGDYMRECPRSVARKSPDSLTFSEGGVLRTAPIRAVRGWRRFGVVNTGLHAGPI